MSDRSLIAYAFLATTWREQGATKGNDLVMGLAPLFSAIAEKRRGELFTPDRFCDDLASNFGFHITRKAAVDWISRLTKARLLHRVIEGNSAQAYRWQAAEVAAVRGLSENDVHVVLNDFESFSSKRLARHKISIVSEELRRSFIDRLVKPDFLALIKRKSAHAKKQVTERTLRLSSSVERDKRNTEEARLDELAADFILDAAANRREIFDHIEKISAGALLAEVVLTLQEPPSQNDLIDLVIYFDAPFLMDLLDLGVDESCAYAKELFEELIAAGCKLRTFTHCVAEIKRNIKAAMEAYQLGQAFGPTGSRLSSPTFYQYASEAAINTADLLQSRAIAIDDAPGGATYSYLTESQENELFAALGLYQNIQAQRRDALSAASIVRLRKAVHGSEREVRSWRVIFVTQNAVLADSARNYLRRRNKEEFDPVSPVFTDRYLAGLLWAVRGGKSGDLPRARLIANCTQAMSPGRDVIQSTLTFIEGLDGGKKEFFQALLENKRVGYYLMSESLGDASLIHEGNAAKLVADVVERYSTEIRTARDAEWEGRIKEREAILIESVALETEKNAQRLELVNHDLAQAKLEAELAADRARQVEQFSSDLQRQALENDNRINIIALGKAHRLSRWIRVLMIGAYLLLFIVLSIFLSDRISQGVSSTIYWPLQIGFIAVGLIGFWKAPENIFGELPRRIGVWHANRFLRELKIDSRINASELVAHQLNVNN